MPFKTNYRQERAQRARNREAKAQEKQARREEASAKRKATRDTETDLDAGGDAPEADVPTRTQEASPTG